MVNVDAVGHAHDSVAATLFDPNFAGRDEECPGALGAALEGIFIAGFCRG
jgi:hypothetical protein